MALNLLGVIRLIRGTSFGWTVALWVALWALVLFEVWLDPLTRKCRKWLAPALVVVAVALSLVVLFPRAPLELAAYSPPSDYREGSNIGGIPWNSHLTDLRVTITNPSSANYKNLDLVLRPEQWVYRASILGATRGCALFPVGGDVMWAAKPRKSGKLAVRMERAGTHIDVYDNMSDVLSTLATRSGYRLRCDALPSNYTIELVFALVDIPRALQSLERNPPPGKTDLGLAEVSGLPNPTDIFGERPPAGPVLVKGTYTRGIRPLSEDMVLHVPDRAKK